jgi:hypothetical protein
MLAAAIADRDVTEADDPGYSRMQLSFLAGASGFRAAVTAREFFHASRSVDKLLFAGEKRMTGRTDADLDVLFRRPCMVNRAASAHDFGLKILGMNVGFHVRKRARNLCASADFRK